MAGGEDEKNPCRFCGGTGTVLVSYRAGDYEEPCGCGCGDVKDFDELFRAMPEEDQKEVLREVAETIPNPGSPAAVSRGCTCPVYDNAHGAGMGQDEHGQVVYVMDWDCPLHGGRERAHDQ